MSYLGLTPSEDTSGEKRRQGAITKTGSRHARRLLVEAAWHYRRPPAKGPTLKRRQDSQPAHIIEISWQAQRRLHRVWQRLDTQRGKRRTIVAVAVARELTGFCWALATPRHRSPRRLKRRQEPLATTRESIRDLSMSSPPRGPRSISDSRASRRNRSCGDGSQPVHPRIRV